MKVEPEFVAVDPVTDQVVFACSGATEDGRCPIAEHPPYVCEGLRVIAVRGTKDDGASVTVDTMVPGHCPVAALTAA